ncbi:MAG: glycosyltransferase family 4 protein [Balneolaceae bacterium]|nr:glycosyltransferase family 4 protein [Balneolaceae bacterium]
MSSRLNILYVSHLHPPENAPLENIGGMQRVSMQLVRQLRRSGDVTVHAEIMKSSWEGIGFRTVGFLLEEAVRLPRLARERGADVILFSSMVTASLAVLLRRRVEIPMVTINHGQDVTMPNFFYQKFVPRVFRNLDGVISVSRATRQACIARGMDPGKGAALANGVDLQKLDRFPGRGESRRRMEQLTGLSLEGRPLLLSVGRMVRRKGHEWFIRQVLPSVDDRAVYLTVGDGPEEENVRRAVEDSPASDRIFLLGRRSDEVLKMAYSAADLFVMPNIPVEGDMEGFGIVMLEANMARTPVVAADLEGIRDVITDGQNGWKIPTRQAGAFAGKINELLAADLTDFGERARAWVLEKFSWEKVAGEYLDFLKKVIENRRNASFD